MDHELFERLEQLYFCTGRGLTLKQGLVEYTAWLLKTPVPCIILGIQLAKVFRADILDESDVREWIDMMGKSFFST